MILKFFAPLLMRYIGEAEYFSNRVRSILIHLREAKGGRYPLDQVERELEVLFTDIQGSNMRRLIENGGISS